MLIRPLALAYKELLTSGAVFKKYGRQGSPHMRFVWLTENQRESTNGNHVMNSWPTLCTNRTLSRLFQTPSSYVVRPEPLQAAARA